MILILGGTTEAAKKAEALSKDNHEFIMTVATDYGFQSFSERFKGRVKKIAFTEETLARFTQENQIHTVYDCTHPYAAAITELAKRVCKDREIPYISLIRETEKLMLDDNVVYVGDFRDATGVIMKKNFMRILLTTGSKSLHEFKGIYNRDIFVRILPSADSIEKCIAAGVAQKRIIAMEGPFSLELNIALIKQFQIQCLVTKNSGKAGGFMEKIEACQKTGITAIVIEPELNSLSN